MLPSLSKKILLLLVVALALLRLVHLGADPPVGVTSSGVFYTDEGWYSRNAAAKILGGSWIVEGDFNPLVNMPVHQLWGYLMFKLFGLSVVSARLGSVIAFLATLLVLYLSLRSRIDPMLLLLALLLVSADFLWFAFSRVGIAENLMILLLVVSFHFALVSSRGRQSVHAALSAAFFLLAFLTKASAIFFLPVMFFLFLPQGPVEERKGGAFPAKVLTAFLVIASGLGVYYVSLVSPHVRDFTYFNSLNVARRMEEVGRGGALMKAVYALKGSALRSHRLALVLYFAGVPACLFALAKRSLRRRREVSALVLWTFLYLVMVAANGYAPPRYYLPVLPVLAVVLVVVLGEVVKGSAGAGRAAASALAAAVLAGSVGADAARVAGYLASPRYSFKEACRTMAPALKGERVVLAGHFANTFALEMVIPSLNDTYGVWPPAKRFETYRPNYYLSYGRLEEVGPGDESHPAARYVRANYQPVLLGCYHVFEDYYKGSPVCLYRLDEKEER